MPAPKKPTTSSTKRKQKSWTVDEIIKILENTIVTLQTDGSEFYYGRIISKQGLPKRTLHDWVGRSEEVKALYQEIVDISEEKIACELIKTSQNSRVNVVGAIFLLKCKFKWIEAAHDKSLSIQEQQVKNEQMKIKIGFVDEGNSDGTDN